MIFVGALLSCVICMPASANTDVQEHADAETIATDVSSIAETLDLSSDALKEIEEKASDADSVELCKATWLSAEGETEDVYVVNITSMEGTKGAAGIGEEQQAMKMESLALLSQYSKLGSNGKYDISVRIVVYYNLSGSWGNQKAELTGVEGRIDDGGTNQIHTKKLVFDGHVRDTSGLYYNYRKTRTVSYPSSGASYWESLSSGYYSTAYDIGSMYEVHFSDDTTLLGWVYI